MTKVNDSVQPFGGLEDALMWAEWLSRELPIDLPKNTYLFYPIARSQYHQHCREVSTWIKLPPVGEGVEGTTIHVMIETAIGNLFTGARAEISIDAPGPREPKRFALGAFAEREIAPDYEIFKVPDNCFWAILRWLEARKLLGPIPVTHTRSEAFPFKCLPNQLEIVNQGSPTSIGLAGHGYDRYTVPPWTFLDTLRANGCKILYESDPIPLEGEGAGKHAGHVIKEVIYDVRDCIRHAYSIHAQNPGIGWTNKVWVTPNRLRLGVAIAAIEEAEEMLQPEE